MNFLLLASVFIATATQTDLPDGVMARVLKDKNGVVTVQISDEVKPAERPKIERGMREISKVLVNDAELSVNFEDQE